MFVDSRQDPYPADLLFRAHLATFEGDYRQLFADYKIACAFVFRDDELAKALASDQWREVAGDEHFTVLRPPQ